MSQGQNIPRDKTSQETKRPKEKKFYISISNFSKTDFVRRLGHIGLGNGPHMYEYSMLGNELNLWIGLFLLWGG